VDALTRELLAYWNESVVEQAGSLLSRTALALLAVLLAYILARLSLGAARRALGRLNTHANARLLVDRLIQFGFLLLAASWVLGIFGIQLTAIVALFGAAALAISLALQDVLKNLVAGMYILLERPFTIGEQIDFRTFSGVVETIELRTTALRTPAGARVVIPNAMIFAEALVNRSAYGRQLLRLRLVLAGDDAGREAHQKILAAVRAAEPVGEDGEVSVHIEALTADKLTLRAEVWTADARRTAPEVAWRVHEQLPRAEISVLE
jgi:small-conductance mechanosensitive channel